MLVAQEREPNSTWTRRQIKAIGLVSTGHFFSHFYMLLLPPLFPVLREVYGVGYTELGFAVTVFSLTSGLTQAPVGYVVDRYGARTILMTGLVLGSLAIACIGLFPRYDVLLGLMVVAGLANAVYHPANYSILNASVHRSRMGRAFSIHTFAGYLGDALAPVTVLFLMSVADWRVALVASGLSGVGVAALMMANSRVLVDAPTREPPAALAGGGPHRTGLGLLLSTPVLMGLLFFVGISMAGRGVSGFSVSALNVLHEAPLTTAGVVLSAYLFASPPGVLVGGWVADHIRRHDAFVAACFALIALVMFAVAALPLPLAAIGALFVVAGFCSGAVAPSRDMMIRAITPPGETGKVFGFVSTGFNIGGVVAPPVYGYLLDRSDPGQMFWVIGFISLATIVTVLVTGRQGRRHHRPS